MDNKNAIQRINKQKVVSLNNVQDWQNLRHTKQKKEDQTHKIRNKRWISQQTPMKFRGKLGIFRTFILQWTGKCRRNGYISTLTLYT
jgi:hypothetical protein